MYFDFSFKLNTCQMFMHFHNFLIYIRKSGQQFALKIIEKEKCKGKEHMIASEVAILRRVKHPNIVHLYAEFDYSLQLYLVMELVKVWKTTFYKRRTLGSKS
jgi:serine/threonine protein kinase